MNITTNQVKLYKNSIPKVIYSTICLLLIGLYLSCGTTDGGGTSPSINYDPLGISFFSVVDGNESPVNDTNAIPVDASFLLTFDQSLGDMAGYTNYLKSQIKLTDMEGSPIDLSIEATQTNQVKITLTTDLSYNTTYQLTVKEGLTIGNYRVTNDITYPITTEKSSDSSLIVLHDNQEFFPSGNNITILLPIGSDPSSVSFTLEVGEGATLQDGNNNDLPLNESRQYSTNMDFSGGATHDFTVTDQDGSTPVTYAIGISQQQDDSKEILSFAFRKTDNSHLKANIAMDVNTNSRTITKTVTNVEGITGLIPYIVHSGSNISPASGVAQDFSTNNTYTVTAIDKSTDDYTVTLTSYYEVTINTNGGSITGVPVITEYILYGKKATSPLDPSQEHYGFKGWYDAPSGGNTFDFNTPITTQTIVYAQWTNKQYQVRFYRGAKLLNTVSVASLTEISTMSYPVHPIPGQTYEWYSDNNLTQPYDKNSLVDGNLDLYTPISDFQKIIEAGTIPSDLANYDDTSETIFSNYLSGTAVIARYVKGTTSGSGDGSSWDNASGDIQAVIDGINDANVDRMYVILVASGTYKPDASYVMKNHIALVGGFIADSYDRLGETLLDGNNDKRVFNNNGNGLDRAALLYGVVITNGKADYGGGMYNKSSSPLLINVTFSGNEAHSGGGIANNNSSGTLMDLDFSGNKADKGGGMFNDHSSSPILNNVDFSSNTAKDNGGGIANNNSSSPILNNVDFSGNKADKGGGMFNDYSSSPILNNVDFSGNKAVVGQWGEGGGMHNDHFASPILSNVIFSGNTSDGGGGGMFNWRSSPTLSEVTFSDNEGKWGGGIYDRQSSTILINVTFSRNIADKDGGGLDNNHSSPTLINVTFSGNRAEDGGGMYSRGSSSSVLNNVTFSGNVVTETTGKGGGIYHDGDGQPLTLINTILWNNNNGQIYLVNDNSDIESVNLYYSRLAGIANPSIDAAGIRLFQADTNANPISIVSEEVTGNDPELGLLADNGGKVDTISISSSSPAKDKGVYVRGVKAGNTNTYSETDLYYSIDNADWFSDPGLTTQENLPSDADDLTDTDARGYSRVGRPDMGAYEEGGTAP